ncbi:MAG: ABC transporter ATP-binding protein [Candidatus Methanofastidiosia archaeon]
MYRITTFKEIWNRSLSYIRPQTHIISVNLLTIGLSALLPFLIKNFIDNLTAGTYSVLLRLGIFIILVATMERITNFWANYMFQRIARRGVCDLQIEVYDHIQNLPLSYFTETETGTIMAKTLSDTQILGQMIAMSLAMLITNITTLIVVIIVLFLLSPFLTGIALCSLPFYYFIFRHYNKRLRKASLEERKSFAEVSESVREKVESVKVIKAFSKEAEFSSRFRRDIESYFERIKAQMYVHVLSLNLGGYVTYILPLIVLFVGGTRVIADVLSLGTVIGFWEYMSRLYEPIQNLAEWNNAMQQSVPTGERIFSLLQRRGESGEGRELKLERAPEIGFRNIWFSYDKDSPVLKGVSLDMPPGKATAIVGASGSGKSTIVSLLYRFYQPDQGHILMDGEDIAEYSLASLRSHLALVEQTSLLINSTIEDNIFMGEDFSQEVLKKVARICLIDDFVSPLPAGYDTNVGEKGITLSAGQIQRIALARAVIRKLKVLIIDEGMSAVDSEIEEKIFHNIKEYLADTTILIVAHRLSTITQADEIAVIWNGQVVARGTHERLVKECPQYNELVRKQIITE